MAAKTPETDPKWHRSRAWLVPARPVTSRSDISGEGRSAAKASRSRANRRSRASPPFYSLDKITSTIYPLDKNFPMDKLMAGTLTVPAEA